MKQPISITALASISPLGSTEDEVWNTYLTNAHCISFESFSGIRTAVARLPKTAIIAIEEVRNSSDHYRNLDTTVLFGIYAARQAVQSAGWNEDRDFGINMGSSRGATALFEKYHQEFLEEGVSSTFSSPTTTLGNISSWIAQDLQTDGPDISHSITCSTALHAVLNGVAWLQSGLSDTFLVGGSEAPLTPFTIAQMKALKIYTSETSAEYPCQAMHLEKTRNSMFLGEGAAVVCLEKGISPNARALITGIGYATEHLQHNISITTDAVCFQKSMRKALGAVSPDTIDVIVMHTPGTIKGDQAEYNAVHAVFGAKHPALTNNKWKIGHTFGASGLLSIEMALLMLTHQHFIPVPYLPKTTSPKKIKRVLVNAVGFGGNAVSVIIEHP